MAEKTEKELVQSFAMTTTHSVEETQAMVDEFKAWHLKSFGWEAELDLIERILANHPDQLIPFLRSFGVSLKSPISAEDAAVAAEELMKSVERMVLGSTTGVEDLGETGPLTINHIDLNKTPRHTLSPITRMALAESAIVVTKRKPIPQMRLKNKVSSAKNYKPAPESIPPRSEGRVGRNDPCPCNSGKKFGNCCLPKLKTL